MKNFIRKYYIYLLLFVIILIGFLIRVWDVDKNPAGFFCDEASVGYNAYSILKTGRDEWGVSFPLLFKGFGQYGDPVMIYSAIPFVKIFGLNEFSVRLTSVFYGTLSILSIFLLTSELLGNPVGFLAALFLAISPWHIQFSRIGFLIISSTFWVPFSLFLLLKSLKKFKTYYPLGIASFFTSFFTYFPVKIYLPILFLAVFFIYFNKTKYWLKKKEFWLINISALIFFIILMFPYFKNNLFLARWNEIKNNSLTIENLFRGYLNHFSLDFLFYKGDIDFPGQLVTRHSIRGIGELYLFQLPLLIFAIIMFFINKKIKELSFFIIFLIIYPLGTIFTDIKPQATRSIIGIIPFQIISAYGLWQIIIFAKTIKLKFFMKLIIWIIISLSFLNYLNLFQKYPNYSSNYWGWQYGPKEIISYFKTQTNNFDELYMTGYFNGTEVFLKFYDPENKCKNCFIGGIGQFDENKKQLFAFRIVEMGEVNKLMLNRRFEIKKTIYLPNSSPEFVIGNFVN
jgi:4-amino-4-deoxy-L-arabinose transferase-like glycosyltransferase